MMEACKAVIHSYLQKYAFPIIFENRNYTDLAKDGRILQAAREAATRILDDDPALQRPEHLLLQRYLKENKKGMEWSKII